MTTKPPTIGDPDEYGPPVEGIHHGPFAVTKPGVYQMTNADYQADPVPGGSLSSSGARRLIPPGCPAKFRHDQLHGRAPKAHYDLGHAAHKYVLSIGEALTVIDADNWRTKAAQQAKAEAYAAGKVPLLKADHDSVKAMADALLKHPIASALFNPLGGQAEQSLFWFDTPNDIWRRARLDWLPYPTGGRLIVPDYKTCRSADPEALQRALADFGYHLQADWYLSGVTALGLNPGGRKPAFVLVCQETEPPYVVTVVEPDEVALRIARFENERAIDTYKACVAADRWPGYSDEPVLISLPRYVENRYPLEELIAS